MTAPTPSTNLRTSNVLVPLDAPITNAPGQRHPDKLRAVVAQFDVVANPRYKVRDTSGDGIDDTFCNIALRDFTRALGCEIAHVGPDGKQRSANAMCDHLASPAGRAEGWMPVDANLAGAEAARGRPVVVTYKAPHGPGHVAILLPPHGTDLRIAQAGRVNLFDVPISRGFGTYPVRFYAHD